MRSDPVNEHCEDFTLRRSRPAGAPRIAPVGRIVGEGPMATLTEMVAAVVVHSSAAAFSHFGVTLEPPKVERPAPPAADQRIVARTPRKALERIEKTSTCPEEAKARLLRA